MSLIFVFITEWGWTWKNDEHEQHDTNLFEMLMSVSFFRIFTSNGPNI